MRHLQSGDEILLDLRQVRFSDLPKMYRRQSLGNVVQQYRVGMSRLRRLERIWKSVDLPGVRDQHGCSKNTCERKTTKIAKIAKDAASILNSIPGREPDGDTRRLSENTQNPKKLGY